MDEKRKISHKISHKHKQKAKMRMKNEFSNLSIRAMAVIAAELRMKISSSVFCVQK